MASYELRTGDTYPPIPVLLTDNSTSPAIDLTNATHVKFELKTGVSPALTGYCQIQQMSITGTFSASSATVTSVTPTTGYTNGATIYCPSAGLPTGQGALATISAGAGTGTLTLSSQASTPGTFAAIVNIGLVWIPLSGSNSVSTATGGVGFITAGTYTGECEINWAAGGIQTVPNAVGSDFQIVVDTDEENG
jgi:hypothetical protein